mgnify:CR=1 FL=1
MGGGVSEIAADTTRVLIESAWFAPQGIRRTSRRHGLTTEASYRFERGADEGMVIAAKNMHAKLTYGVTRKIQPACSETTSCRVINLVMSR